MQDIWQDARYGLRLLKREPGFALVAALTIALGIGATTTLFSVANGVLLKPLPWPNASSLMSVTETRDGRTGRVRGTVSNGTFLAWQDRQPATIDGLAGWLTQTQTLTGVGDPERLHVIPATPSLFTLLDAHPLLGRLFDAGEGARGQEGVVLLSFGLWQTAFGGRKDVVGGRVQLDGKPFTIVGVMPREFAFPDRETRAWTAWSVPPVHGEGNSMQGTIFRSIARLRRGVTPAQASAEATAAAHGGPDMGVVALALFGSKAPADVTVTPLADALTAEVKPAILVMLVAVALLLATATANVASLQLARATTRRQELAIRAAIGAGGGRLARQLLIESAMLGLAGGAAGLALALALNRVLPSMLPADFPRLDAVTIDGRVLLFGFLMTMVTSVACSLMPVLHARRIDLAASLAERDNAPSGGGLRSRTARARVPDHGRSGCCRLRAPCRRGASRTELRRAPPRRPGLRPGQPADSASAHAGRLSAGATATAGRCAADPIARAAGRDACRRGQRAAVRVVGRVFSVHDAFASQPRHAGRRSGDPANRDAGLLQGAWHARAGRPGARGHR